MGKEKDRSKAGAEGDALLDGEAGALQVGPTDHGMVRIIVTTADGVFELDFPPEEAREIAEELTSASNIALSASAGKSK